ncbi:hypothetical protein [Acidiphilium sp.]|uniref:hypothetical protein n=1 Tax=Acidiphilium sp. TaxID=527 RepID=UPI0038D08997
MEQMHISPDFTIRSRKDADRVSFQFTAQGDRQTGVIYLSANVAPGADLVAEARKAAKKVAKRAGADTVTLCAVMPAMR